MSRQPGMLFELLESRRHFDGATLGPNDVWKVDSQIVAEAPAIGPWTLGVSFSRDGQLVSLSERTTVQYQLLEDGTYERMTLAYGTPEPIPRAIMPAVVGLISDTNGYPTQFSYVDGEWTRTQGEATIDQLPTEALAAMDAMVVVTAVPVEQPEEQSPSEPAIPVEVVPTEHADPAEVVPTEPSIPVEALPEPEIVEPVAIEPTVPETIEVIEFNQPVTISADELPRNFTSATYDEAGVVINAYTGSTGYARQDDGSYQVTLYACIYTSLRTNGLQLQTADGQHVAFTLGYDGVWRLREGEGSIDALPQAARDAIAASYQQSPVSVRSVDIATEFPGDTTVASAEERTYADRVVVVRTLVDGRTFAYVRDWNGTLRDEMGGEPAYAETRLLEPTVAVGRGVQDPSELPVETTSASLPAETSSPPTTDQPQENAPPLPPVTEAPKMGERGDRTADAVLELIADDVLSVQQ